MNGKAQVSNGGAAGVRLRHYRRATVRRLRRQKLH
jgi:hypothetical protein